MLKLQFHRLEKELEKELVLMVNKFNYSFPFNLFLQTDEDGWYILFPKNEDSPIWQIVLHKYMMLANERRVDAFGNEYVPVSIAAA